MQDRHRDIALFRYSLIREAADPSLSSAERGRLVRYLAARDHLGPHRDRVQVGRSTLDRWIRAWRTCGFDALVPEARAAQADMRRSRPQRSFLSWRVLGRVGTLGPSESIGCGG